MASGRYDDGSPRRHFRRVSARNRSEAVRHLAVFVAEVQTRPVITPRRVDETVDQMIETYLVEHLAGEKGREPKTVDDYRRLHRKWFAPRLGRQRVRDIRQADMDAAFGAMRRAKLSRSRMNQARSLYAPFFKWAISRQLADHDPMANFKLPTSLHTSRERTPPELHELCQFLNASIEHVPDVAPVLTLGAVTGMRRGELAGVRRSKINWTDGTITIDTAIDVGRRVKRTKTRTERTISIDDETVAMLRRHCDAMDARAVLADVTVAPDGYLFSLAIDCSQPIPPDHLTKRVAVLKDHLGIADKRATTVALEDEALRLHRLPPRPRPAGRTGPPPRGGQSFREIASELGRSERWVAMAVASAQRREGAVAKGLHLAFDGSIVALRKFTSSELLDAGFNISMVAHRQGHGPQVLVKHYAKSRRSADRRAAQHLGAVVHRTQT